jgi:acyl-CoA synthetase (AMP-forming)/AMP-acid ligase II
MAGNEPGGWVETRGDAPAIVMGESGETVSYRELDARSKRWARALRRAGLRPGGHVAILLENHPRYFELVWGALRSGLYVTPINWHLKAEEVGYIVEDCEATALVTSHALAALAGGLEPHLGRVKLRLMVDGAAPGFDAYEDAVAREADSALEDETEGAIMFYSSGTTGRPKGIKPPLSGSPFGATSGGLTLLFQFKYGVTAESTYLCPAPLYHAAPLGWSTSVQRLGGTVVVMERFDPGKALELIARHRITHAQFVPTHFVRMLTLPPAERRRADVSSLQKAIHAAAPCPIEVKREMLAWWGNVIEEYYAGSEGNGFCAIGPEEWLAHPGSVGKPLLGKIHIVSEDQRELPPGEAGQIWFESETRFEYHNDPRKTAEAFNDRGWSSLGDIGYLDAEGFLYLTDRASHMIISGGVNIYPQEVENELVMHPAVADVAVIGVPHPEMGEQVKAVVVAAEGASPGTALETELVAFCRARIAHYKCPTSVDFVDSLPRLPTGKLRKAELRRRYWPAA